MRKLGLLVFLFGLVVGVMGCSSDDEEPAVVRASYRGELQVDFDPTTVGEQWTDTVLFSVNSGVYSVTHLTSNGNPASLCDSEGRIGGFNTAQVRLEVQNYFGSGCSQRGPSGEFTARFSGDSLILDNIDQTQAVIEFRLLRTGATSSSLYPTR